MALQSPFDKKVTISAWSLQMKYTHTILFVIYKTRKYFFCYSELYYRVFLRNSCSILQFLLKDVSREMLHIIYFFDWINLVCFRVLFVVFLLYLNGQARKLVIIAQLSPIYTYVEIWGYLTCYKVPLYFWFNYSLDSTAEIHEIFSLFFWKI